MSLLYYNKKQYLGRISTRSFRSILIALVWLFFSHMSFAASVEYKIKAAYIYNFTKFVTWPEHQSETFNVCLLGKDPFGEMLDKIQARTALGLPIKLLRMQKFNAAKSSECHILFLGSEARRDIQQVIASSGILTVSEKNDFAKQGGMIGFIVKGGKVKLQINIDRLRLGGLKISAKLLEIAEIIGRNGDG